MPFSPLSWFKIRSIASGSKPSVRSRWVTAEGSRLPERVPISKPSVGVRPMEVSMERPWSTAQIEAPFPR